MGAKLKTEPSLRPILPSIYIGTFPFSSRPKTNIRTSLQSVTTDWLSRCVSSLFCWPLPGQSAAHNDEIGRNGSRRGSWRLREIIAFEAAHFQPHDVDHIDDRLPSAWLSSDDLASHSQSPHLRASEGSIDAKQAWKASAEGFRTFVLATTMRTSSSSLLCATILDAPRNTIREFISLFIYHISSPRVFDVVVGCMKNMQKSLLFSRALLSNQFSFQDFSIPLFFRPVPVVGKRS